VIFSVALSLCTFTTSFLSVKSHTSESLLTIVDPTTMPVMSTPVARTSRIFPVAASRTTSESFLETGLVVKMGTHKTSRDGSLLPIQMGERSPSTKYSTFLIFDVDGSQRTSTARGVCSPSRVTDVKNRVMSAFHVKCVNGPHLAPFIPS